MHGVRFILYVWTPAMKSHFVAEACYSLCHSKTANTSKWIPPWRDWPCCSRWTPEQETTGTGSRLHPSSTELGMAARSLQGMESLSLTSASFGSDPSKAVCLSWAALQGNCFQVKSGLSLHTLHIFSPTKSARQHTIYFTVRDFCSDVTPKFWYKHCREDFSDRPLPSPHDIFLLSSHVPNECVKWTEIVFLSCLQNIPWRLRAFVFT